jgi:hypothetical protein
MNQLSYDLTQFYNRINYLQDNALIALLYK